MIKILTIESSLNQQGEVLKPDIDGYYTMNGGALNVENSSGIFYIATERTLDRLRNQQSFVNRKIQAKELYGEYQHPIMPPEIKKIIHTKKGMAQWMERQMVFDRDYVSHHIKEISMFEVPGVIDNKTGKTKIMIQVKIKPFGPKAKLLKEALENPNISTALSVRSAVVEEVVNGRTEREIIEFFTWDFVFSPGIKGSTDQRTLGYEFDKTDLETFQKYIKDEEIKGHENDYGSINTSICVLREAFKKKSNNNPLLNDW